MGDREAQEPDPVSTAAAKRRRLARAPGVVTALVSCALLSLSPGPAADATRPTLVQATCDPQVHVLSSLTPTSREEVTGSSDAGLVVGVSTDGRGPSAAVVWTDLSHITDIGLGGVDESGRLVHASATDVNEVGQVAVNRRTVNARGRSVAAEAVVWSESDGVTELPAPDVRPWATVFAINDGGDAVGVISGRGVESRPVVWRDSRRSVLRTPAKFSTYAADINNHGLVVGGYLVYERQIVKEQGGWFWDLSSGDRGRLRSPQGRHEPAARVVDSAGRIIGAHPIGPGDDMRTVLWRQRTSRPRTLFGLAAGDLHDSGYVAAVEPGSRGFDASAWVGHRRDGGVAAPLANLPADAGASDWDNVYAVAVARGVSAFAPQGGVTIAGYAQNEDRFSRSVLWTCTQTLLGP